MGGDHHYGTAKGIGLAKDVFQIHGIDGHGKVYLRQKVRRNQMAKFFAILESCLIGIEACGSAHYWALHLG